MISSCDPTTANFAIVGIMALVGVGACMVWWVAATARRLIGEQHTQDGVNWHDQAVRVGEPAPPMSKPGTPDAPLYALPSVSLKVKQQTVSAYLAQTEMEPYEVNFLRSIAGGRSKTHTSA